MSIGLLDDDYVSDYVKINSSTIEVTNDVEVDDNDNNDILKVDPMDVAQQYVNWVELTVSSTSKDNYERLCMIEFIKLKLQEAKLSNDDMKTLMSGDPYGDDLRDRLQALKTLSAEITSEYLQHRVVAYKLETDENSWIEGVIKFRRCFETSTESAEYAEIVAKSEPVFPVFSDGSPYKFYPFNQDHTLIEKQKTPNTLYDQLNKGYHDNVKAVEAQRNS
jgi:hypothetical protein